MRAKRAEPDTFSKIPHDLVRVAFGFLILYLGHVLGVELAKEIFNALLPVGSVSIVVFFANFLRTLLPMPECGVETRRGWQCFLKVALIPIEDFASIAPYVVGFFVGAYVFYPETRAIDLLGLVLFSLSYIALILAFLILSFVFPFFERIKKIFIKRLIDFVQTLGAWLKLRRRTIGIRLRKSRKK